MGTEAFYQTLSYNEFAGAASIVGTGETEVAVIADLDVDSLTFSTYGATTPLATRVTAYMVSRDGASVAPFADSYRDWNESTTQGSMGTVSSSYTEVSEIGNWYLNEGYPLHVQFPCPVELKDPSRAMVIGVRPQSNLYVAINVGGWG